MIATTKQVERFQRDGFVVVGGLLDEEELSRYGRAVRAAVAERKRDDRRAVHDKTRYEQSFMQCMNLWEDFPEVRGLTFHQRIGQVAAELLGVEAIRLWHDQALFKEAGGRETDLHQDQAYWAMAETDTITAWIPFAGSTHENGCMGYIPGSHLNGVRRFVDIFRGDDDDVENQSRDLKTNRVIYVEVPPGAVAFHHGLTAHEAKANTSQDMREVHTMIFFRDGITRATEGRHYAVDRAGIEPGEPIASDVTPVVWPRGDLPEPPAPIEGLSDALKSSGAFPRNSR